MLSGVWDPKPDGTLGSNFSKNLSDDQVKAYGSYVCCYDNLGRVSAEVSDHLARMSTGDLIEKRKLYSDADMVTINYRRTGVFTANSLGGVKPDVVDRLVKIRCERVPELGRRSERQMAREWARVAPEVLGGVLDLVVRALGGLDAVMASGMALPRMADYYQVLTAVDATLGRAYWDAVSGAMTEIAKEDPLLVALSDWLTSVGDEWVGEPKDLYTAFSDAKQMVVLSEGGHWPRDTAALSRQLTTHAEPLRKLGVHRENGRSGRARSVRLYRR